MARADSTIRVNIIGDAKGLSKELAKADKGLAGFGASAKGLVGGIGLALAARELVDFAGDALAEADRLGDATKRLELQVGDLASQLVDTADEWSRMGQSTQDMLELEAAVVDVGTALGLTDAELVALADDAAATAAAIELLGGADAATNVDLIGKAAAGSAKAMRALGVSVSETDVVSLALATTGKTTAESLTKGELAAARYTLVLEALKPKLDAVAQGSGDVEQKQAELQARWETLTGRIGQGIEGPLNDLLGWILSGIDGLERLDEGIEAIRAEFLRAIGPVLAFAGALEDVLFQILQIAAHGMLPTGGTSGGGGGGSGGGFGSQGSGGSISINVQALDSAAAERAVIDAMRAAAARNGELR